MLDIVHGPANNVKYRESLERALAEYESEGLLLFSFPVFPVDGEGFAIDATFLSPQLGVVVFFFHKGDTIDIDRCNQLTIAMENQLRSDSRLTDSRRRSRVPVTPIIYCPFSDVQQVEGFLSADESSLLPLLIKESRQLDVDVSLYETTKSVVEQVDAVKVKKKRVGLKRPDSKGAILASIESTLANLDRWQNKAAIETPEYAQRIRGLAGSGKTVVLALKAAYIHALFSDWEVGVTFFTQSLYQQFRKFVEKFFLLQMKCEPAWENLRILHAWGAGSMPGVCSEIARINGLELLTFDEAKNAYGYDDAFDGLCKDLLRQIQEREIEAKQIFDALLIDEAQDLPASFFQLAYLSTKPPKRIVFAYDELQNLTNEDMPPPEELFGYDSEGNPRIELKSDTTPKQDITLPICYRNPPWILAAAHALGFGIYRAQGLVQVFSDETLWERSGYEVSRGDWSPGETISLVRNKKNIPKFFDELLDDRDSLQWHVFADETQQALYIAKEVKRSLDEDEIVPSDIIIIVPRALDAAKRIRPIRAALQAAGVRCHEVGKDNTSRDQFWNDDSVCITHIFRAKGNEAPLVFVVDAHYCASGHGLSRKRNTLFAAVTRARAWVRITGYGAEMQAIADELSMVRKNNYELRFQVPTSEEVAKLKVVHRDLTKDEERSVSKYNKQAVELAKGLAEGKLSVHHLEPDVMQQLRNLLSQEEE